MKETTLVLKLHGKAKDVWLALAVMCRRGGYVTVGDMARMWLGETKR